MEPVVSDPRDELADADIISGGGEDFDARCPRLAGIIRSRRARIIAIPVLAAALAGAVVTVTGSHPASEPVPPAQQVTITNTAVGATGVVGPDGWAGPAGCRRGSSCPKG